MTSKRRHNVKARIMDHRTLRPASGPLSVACPRESCQAPIGHRCRWMVGANWRPLKAAHPERRVLVRPCHRCTERHDYDGERIRTHCKTHCPRVRSGDWTECRGC